MAGLAVFVRGRAVAVLRAVPVFGLADLAAVLAFAADVLALADFTADFAALLADLAAVFALTFADFAEAVPFALLAFAFVDFAALAAVPFDPVFVAMSMGSCKNRRGHLNVYFASSRHPAECGDPKLISGWQAVQP